MSSLPINQIAPEPATIADTGLSEAFLVELVAKLLHQRGPHTVQQLSQAICLPGRILDEVLAGMKQQMLVQITGSSGSFQLPIYSLIERGVQQAKVAFDRSDYIGPAPIPLAQYLQVQRLQAEATVDASAGRVRSALAGLCIRDSFIDSLGTAVSSGKPILLYGRSGNGKSTIAAAVGKLFSGAVLIPYAIELHGTIMCVFDPAVHELMGSSADESPASSGVDRRLAICRRPTVIAGGELTLADLDPRRAGSQRYYLAPLQMRASGGVLVIDDFGRQAFEPSALLNRWIRPLETGEDIIRFADGQIASVPFTCQLVFTTNLAPDELNDQALVRRLRYKLAVPSPTRDEFFQILRSACQDFSLTLYPSAIEFLDSEFFGSRGENLRASDARDVAETVLEIARYRDVEPRMSRDLLIQACAFLFGMEVDEEVEIVTESVSEPDSSAPTVAA